MTEPALLGVPTRYMNDDEEALATAIYGAIQRQSNYSVRSGQARDFKVGVSDLGFCSERVRRMLDHQVPDDQDVLPAWIGTAIGDHAEQAITAMWPHAIRQAEVSVTLTGERATYTINGHPDVIVSNKVIDVKTGRGLAIPQRQGPSQQQQFQRHCYALGAWEAGLFGDTLLDDVQVANVWIDRAADDRELYVQMEAYDPDVVKAAGWWLDDVMYAYLYHDEARKEPPREMCYKVCGFAPECRGGDIIDEQGLLTDDTILASVEAYTTGAALEREGKRLKDQAKAHLTEIHGSTGEYAISWTRVNESEVSYTRGAYDRLNVRKVK